MNSFLGMGKSSSNIPNVFMGSSLTGHRIRVYSELRGYLLHSLIFPHSLRISKILNGNNEFCILRENILSLRSEYFILPGLRRYRQSLRGCRDP